jgi:hypothetical protein
MLGWVLGALALWIAPAAALGAAFLALIPPSAIRHWLLGR